jgi:hypothetical protein
MLSVFLLSVNLPNVVKLSVILPWVLTPEKAAQDVGALGLSRQNDVIFPDPKRGIKKRKLNL